MKDKVIPQEIKLSMRNGAKPIVLKYDCIDKDGRYVYQYMCDGSYGIVGNKDNVIALNFPDTELISVGDNLSGMQVCKIDINLNKITLK